MSQNFSQYFRTLQILFFSLFFGQIGIISVLYFVRQPPVVEQLLQQDFILKVLPVGLVLLMGLAFFLNRKKLETARNQATLKEKLAEYRAASIMKWAPLEGGTLICAVLFFVNNNITYLYYAVVMLALFATRFPSRQRLMSELDLSVNEQMTLDDPNAEVAETTER